MKKYLALLLALATLLACAACSRTPADTAETTPDAGDIAEPVALSVTKLEFSVAEADATAEGFLCVVDRGDMYHWQIGVDTFDDLYETFNLTADESTYVNVFVAADNEESYPYLYPEQGWKAYVAADSIANWFTEDFQEGLTAAFNEWIGTVYSKFDYETIRSATADKYIEASPSDDYVVTEDDIELFYEYAANSFDRDNFYTLLCEELGKSAGDDAYLYLKTKVADKVKNKANCGTLLKNMGITNTGGTQENFCGGIVATYFSLDCDAWVEMGLDETIAIMNKFLERGLTFSNASDNMNRLHAIDGGRILYEASVNETSNNNAFAIVAGKDGTLYWRVGIDNCEAIRTVFELSGGDYVDLQVLPVLDYEKAEYSLPDGLNPEVTRYFIYFEDEAVTWTLETRGGVEFPDWFTTDMENAVMAACAEWKAEAYSHFDFDAALAMFPDEFKETGTYTDEDVALLKEYVTILNDLEAQGTSMASVLRESINAACGSTLWGEMTDWVAAKWRMVHTDCPSPCIKIGYCLYYGLVSFNQPDEKVDDGIVTALAGSAFTGIDWTYTTKNGGYPFQAAVDLMNKGLVAYTDYRGYWYLASGSDCNVIFAITEAEMLAG